MAQYNSLQMTPPRYPVSGPLGAGRTLQNSRGIFNLGTQSTGAINSGDTVLMFKVHRNFLVRSGALKWDALGTGVTLSLGDAANPTRYFNAVSAATAGSTTAIADTGRDYNNTALTTIILTIGGGTTNATGQILAELTGVIENPA